jgi:acyl dehydratase
MEIGQAYRIENLYSIDEVKRFSELSKDTNPIHLDEEYAKKSIFGKRIVPGMLISSLFSGIIANHLPGPGSIYLQQDLKFKAPIYLGEKFIVEVKIIEIRNDKPIYTLETTCYKGNNEIAISGAAIILKK